MPGSLRCTPANPKRHKNTAQEKKDIPKLSQDKKQPKLSQEKKIRLTYSSAIIVRIPMVLSMATK